MEEVVYYGSHKVDGMNVVADFGIQPKHSVYSDRLFQWDSQKYNQCCREVWKNEAQSFYDRDASDIEKFLQLYLGDSNVRLCRVLQDENRATGYPYWRFDYVVAGE